MCIAVPVGRDTLPTTAPELVAGAGSCNKTMEDNHPATSNAIRKYCWGICLETPTTVYSL